jgi:DNA-binding CsgD family transcriptional regulator
VPEPERTADPPTRPSDDLPGWASRRPPPAETDLRADELLGPAGAGPADRAAALRTVFDAELDGVRETLRRHGEDGALAALDRAERAERVERELTDRDVRRRITALVSVQEALGGLRQADSVATILRIAPRKLAEACGFDRANLFKVDNGCMIMESNYWCGDPDGAAEMLSYSRGRPARLEHMLLETEMIRRRSPCLVLDAPNDSRVPRGLADFARTRSYVAAPIMPSGRVIGFVHADCLYQGRLCDTIDRDLVWAFAEGFGYAFERTVMAERLRRQHDRARDALATTVREMAEVVDGELRLSHAETGAVPSTRRAAGALLDPDLAPAGTMTARETEVLSLMATGMTNQAIADELVVTVGTVKAHVKHVLRKLGAANRSEAIARHLGARRSPAG